MHMSHNIEIQEGAILLGDAHYSLARPELLDFIRAIEKKEIQTPQLILMGDLFDALFGCIDYTYKENQELIELLNQLSFKIEIIYLEGNHDFNLHCVFSNIKIFSIQNQPVLSHYKDQKVCLAHGDFDGKLGYKIYTAIIRKNIVLHLLRHLDSVFNHFILKFVYKHLSKKEDCKELSWFEGFIQKRFGSACFECEVFIEGHFHQNKVYKLQQLRYINLAAFACNQRYFRVKSSKDNTLLLDEQRFRVGEKNYG